MKTISILVKAETEKALFGLIMSEMGMKRSVWFPKAWLTNISEKRYVDPKTGRSVEISERYVIAAEILEKNYSSKLEESIF